MSDETRGGEQGVPHKFPKWAPQVGVVFLGATIVFLMALVLTTVFLGKPIPDAGRFLIVAVIALSMAVGTAFLGGNAVAEGKLRIPGASDHPVRYTLGGAAAVFAIILVLGMQLYSAPGEKQIDAPADENDAAAGNAQAAAPTAEPPAGRSSEPDYKAEPSYGTLQLSAGFTPDPQMQMVQAGGRTRRFFGNCSGWIHASAPDLAVDYQRGEYTLAFYAAADADVMLAVRAPDGQWYCGDDYEATNPVVFFDRPASGRYHIWVGTYHEPTDILPQAALFITESIPGA